MHGIPPHIPILRTPRLVLSPFRETDIPALAAMLGFPDVSKGILADGSTPTRARKHAARRVHWHNATWPTHGYGIWAIRFPEEPHRQDDTPGSNNAAPRHGPGPDNTGNDNTGANNTGDHNMADDAAERVKRGPAIGWCGFTRPDLGRDPELLYGLHPGHWHQGLATEATRAALDWLFTTTPHRATSAVIFGRINQPSTALVERLGFERQGRLAIKDFLADLPLAREVLAFETWRLRKGKSAEPTKLLFEAPHKVGQIASLFPADQARIADALRTAATARTDIKDVDQAERMLRVRTAFEQGLAEPWLDWWRKGK